ncbi:MAG TPA: hypothetical protein VFW00_12975 [Rhodocyclaceae bacterium]|nr:hypothetical protein [Rhodocyclaceae bacterium]
MHAFTSFDEILPVPELEKLTIDHAELVLSDDLHESLVMTFTDGSTATLSIDRTAKTPVLNFEFEDAQT